MQPNLAEPLGQEKTSAHQKCTIRVSIFEDDIRLPEPEEDELLLGGEDAPECCSVNDAMQFFADAERRTFDRGITVSGFEDIDAFELVERAYQIVGYEAIQTYIDMRRDFECQIDPSPVLAPPEGNQEATI